MSIRSELVFVSTLLCMSAAACGSLFNKQTDAGADAGLVVVGNGIANEAAITRYAADERPASGEVKTLKSAVVHSTFPGTDIVATLPVDSTVIELATYAGGVLIVFEQAGSKRMGWVDAAVVPPIAAAVEDAAAGKAAPTKVVPKDAGAKVTDAGAVAPVVVDAGAVKPVVVDAGAVKPPLVVVDAGAKPAGTTKQVLKDMPASGKCEVGYYEFPKDDKKCRLVCKVDADCGGQLKCRDTKGPKVCYR